MDRKKMLASAMTLVTERCAVTPRFMPVSDDTLEPTLFKGDMVAVVPADRFTFDSLYVLEFNGEPKIYRCTAHLVKGGIMLSLDNKFYAPFDAITDEQFRETVVGRVVAALKFSDRAWMEGR